MSIKIEENIDIKAIQRRNKSQADDSIRQTLKTIETDVQKTGDKAVIAYTQKFDKIDPKTFSITLSDEEWAAADTVSTETIEALTAAKTNIEAYHQRQVPTSWQDCDENTVFGQRFQPIESVALYVPGGRAIYPSTVLMNAIPAKIAGCERLVIVTPPNAQGKIDPTIIAAAKICGIDTIYKVGGAQAIFALAHGTESIAAVDKIVGPGNQYVNGAKQMVYGTVDIDKPAGPSEVLVYIKEPKYAEFAASELLAQMEHDPDAVSIAVSENRQALYAIQSAIEPLLERCKRQDIIKAAMKNARLVHCTTEADSIKFINDCASEHLVLLFEDYNPILKQVKHAGSIFCGPYSPVTIGDYYAGTNHVLPTEGAARFASPLGVMDFMKYSSVTAYSKKQLEKSAKHIQKLTDIEGLDAHYLALDLRLKS